MKPRPDLVLQGQSVLLRDLYDAQDILLMQLEGCNTVRNLDQKHGDKHLWHEMRSSTVC